MKLNYITIMIASMEKSITFYENLVGLCVQKRFSPGAIEIAFLANAQGETMLELIQGDGSEIVLAKNLVLSFLASDIAAIHEKAAALGYQPSEILSHGAKPPFFTVADPDGITVEFSV